VIAERLTELQPRTGVKIHPGCDFHLHASNIADALAHPEKYTINHGNYLLVEFPEMSKFRVAGEIFRQLLEAGLIPIISHPERNAHLRGQLDDLAQWIQEGCYLQVTAASFTGLFGPDAKRTAWQLVERGMTHFVASDAHDTKRRTPNLHDAWTSLVDRFGEDTIAPLFIGNPADVLRNDIVDAAVPQLKPAGRKWWQVWRR
jgi:protein-tyrosine phosphatase